MRYRQESRCSRNASGRKTFFVFVRKELYYLTYLLIYLIDWYYTGRFLLLRTNFNSFSCLHFHPILLIATSIPSHYYAQSSEGMIIVLKCGVTSQYVKNVIFRQNTPIFKFCCMKVVSGTPNFPNLGKFSVNMFSNLS